MLSTESLTLAVLILLAATLYSSVGHAGASGYLASMALVGIAPESMKVTALVLNVLVAVLGSIRYIRAGHFDWQTFYPFAIMSIPAAFIGGVIHLPPSLYKPAVGAILLMAAVQLIRSAHNAVEADAVISNRAVPVVPALATGGVIGLISGLTGTGGGIFRSPVLLLGRGPGARREVLWCSSWSTRSPVSPAQPLAWACCPLACPYGLRRRSAEESSARSLVADGCPFRCCGICWRRYW
jgi:uncharacterized membrane protein YfcA